MTGWIKISRELPEHWIWQDSNRLKWWLDLLFMASWEDSKQLVGSRLVEIKRGQLVASISFLEKRWGIGHNTVIAFLKMLQKEKMITKSSMRNISIITISNYDKHQAADNLADELNGYKSEQCTITDNITPDNPADNRQAQNRTFSADNPADNLSEYLNIINSMQYQPTPKSIADNLSERSADSLADNPADTNKEYKNIRSNNIKKQTKSEDEDFSDFETAFEVFRKAYPGTKRGYKIEFENLKKKYPKSWCEIVPLLLPAIEREIIYHQQATAAGRFVPSYKHLQTWINNAAWETEFPTIPAQQSNESQKESPNVSDYSDTDFGGMDY